MPANVYECMFLLDTNKVAGDLAAATKQLHAILERNHAEILVTRPWDERRLAYPIKKSNISHKKGQYYLIYFRSEGNNLVSIENDFKLCELVIRMLTLHVDPKLVDAMLAVARDEHVAVHFQTVHESVGDEDSEEGMDGGPPRRRDRRMAEAGKDE